MTINIDNIKAGDTVTLVHSDPDEVGDEQRDYEVREVNGEPWIEHAGLAVRLASLVESGYEIINHKPKVVFPTEPGAYVDALGYTTVIAPNGDLFGQFGDPLPRGLISLPLTRLVPEGSEREQAIREVIDWIEDGRGFLGDPIASARAHFGVTP